MNTIELNGIRIETSEMIEVSRDGETVVIKVSPRPIAPTYPWTWPYIPVTETGRFPVLPQTWIGSRPDTTIVTL